MSMPISIYRCTGCSSKWPTHQFWGMRLYLLENGQTVSVPRYLGGCENCRDLKEIERIPDEAEMYEQFTAAYDKFRERDISFKRTFFGSLKPLDKNKVESYELFRESLEEARNAVEWRKNRKSRPRCLTCGSHDVSSLDVSCIHPGCGGTFMTEETDIRIATRTKRKFYDTEGNFLREEEVGAYEH